MSGAEVYPAFYASKLCLKRRESKSVAFRYETSRYLIRNGRSVGFDPLTNQQEPGGWIIICTVLWTEQKFFGMCRSWICCMQTLLMPHCPFHWSALLSSQEWIHSQMTRSLHASHLEVLFPDGTLTVIRDTWLQASRCLTFRCRQYYPAPPRSTAVPHAFAPSRSLFFIVTTLFSMPVVSQQFVSPSNPGFPILACIPILALLFSNSDFLMLVLALKNLQGCPNCPQGRVPLLRQECLVSSGSISKLTSHEFQKESSDPFRPAFLSTLHVHALPPAERPLLAFPLNPILLNIPDWVRISTATCNHTWNSPVNIVYSASDFL